MLLIKICAVYYIFLSIVAKIHALVPLIIVEDNNIAATERAIRNTVNDLFAAFKIQGIRTKPKIRQFSTIHNFFVSITLKNCNSLEEIARLSTANTIDNNTSSFIAQINEVLNEDDKNKEENDNNIYVTTYIQIFITELKRLKELLVPKRSNVINAEILKYFDRDRTLTNVTEDNYNTSKTNKDLKDENILDDDEFWQPSGRRVYKGIRTSIKHYPFMASIHIFDQFQCAGSIIQNDLIITSSSCLQIAWNNRFFRENPMFLSVKVGCEYYDFCGDSIAVLEIYFHPYYTPKTLKHNLAIMRLTRKINFRNSHGRVKKINFDRYPWPLPSNSRITVIGWGAKDTSNIVYDIFSNKLSYAELDFYPMDDCIEHYSKNFVTSKNFCAGFYSTGGGACNRDAGGPGIVDKTLIGVISFGSPECGATDAPTVFTKLGFYSDWIEEIMEQNSVGNGARTTATPLDTTFLLYEKPTIPTTKKFEMHPLGDITTSTVNIDEKDMLRIPQKQSFKDFLSTMFSREEIKYFVDVSDTETKDVINTDQNENQLKAAAVSDERIIKDTKVRTKPTVVSTTPVATLTDSPHDDMNENIDEIERSGETVTESQKRFTVLENADNDDESSEEDITRLIDNLNLDQTVESHNPLFIAGQDGTIKENDFTHKKKITSLKNKTTSNKAKSQVRESTTFKKVNNPVKELTSLQTVTAWIDVKHQVKAVPWVNYLTDLNKVKYQNNKVTSNTIKHQTVTSMRPITDSNKAENDYRKNPDMSTSEEYDNHEEGGLSIQAEPYMDLTLRDRADNINKNGVLTEAEMFDLISLAIEEQTKQLHKKKRYLL